MDSGLCLPNAHSYPKSWQELLKILKKKFSWFDWSVISSALLVVIYYTILQPIFLIEALVLFVCLPQAFKLPTPLSQIQLWGIKVKFQYILGVILSLAFVLLANDRAYAFLFNNIETSVTDVMTQSGFTDTAFITTLFTLVRLVVVFGIVGGIVAAAVQAVRGNEVMPIIICLFIGVATVIAIEAFSRWVLGTTVTP
jgi:hypothetical protein